MSSTLMTPGGSIDPALVQQMVSDEIAAQLAALPAPFSVASSDPTGAAFSRGALAMYSGNRWVGVPSSFVTLSAAGTAWVAGSGGESPIQLVSTTVPVGTNGTPGYSASATVTGGSVAADGKYQSVAVVAGVLPAWATLTKVVGGFTITGNPNATATTALTIRVTDLIGFFTDVVLSIQIVAAGQPLAINMPANLPPAQLNVDYVLNIVALYVTGGSGVITAVSSSSLPNKKIRVDTNGSVTGTVGMLYTKTVAWGGVSDPPNTVATINVQITVTDSLGANASQTVSLAITGAATPSVDIASWVSTDYNKSTGVGHYQGTAIPVVPSAVAGAINQVPTGTRIYSTVAGGAGGLAIGCAAGASAWNGGILTTLADFDLLGTTPGTKKAVIILAPNQPVNAPGVTGQIMAHANAVTQVLNVEIDGNRAHQTVGVNTDPNPAGCYYTGVRRQNCGIGGGVTGTLRLRNIRGVVGSKDTNYNGTHKLATETFCFQDIGGAGADQLVIELINDDGGTKNNTSSGAVFQYRQIGAPAWVVTLLNCDNQRHGIGCYCGGSGFVLVDASASLTNNGHLFNFEAGDTTGSATKAPTGDIAVAVINGSIANTSGNDLVASCNSNNASGSPTQQIHSLTISGIVSTGDDEFIAQSGSSGYPGTLTLNNIDVVSPTLDANNFSSGSGGVPIYRAENAAALFLNSCRVHLTVGGSVATKGGALHAGNGVWTPF